MSKILPILLFLLLFCSTASAETIFVNETGWYRSGDAFNASATPIQHAVDNATSGDTVYIWNGSYMENVDILTSSLTIKGEGRDVVTVTAASTSDDVFRIGDPMDDVMLYYVNLSGISATGATDLYRAGIFLGRCTYCNISDNNASNNGVGIWSLMSGGSTTFVNNIANSNGNYGIYLWVTDGGNTLTNNTANSNTHVGIFLRLDDINTLTNNTANLNGEHGIIMLNSDGNIFTNNTANLNAKIGTYLRTSSDNNLFDTHNSIGNTEYDYYAWATSINNTLLNCNLSNTSSMMNDSTSQWIIKYTDNKITDFDDATLNQKISPTDVTTYIQPTVDDYAKTITTLDDFTATTDVSTATLQLVEFNSGGHSKFKVSSDTPTVVTTFNIGTFTVGEPVRLIRNGRALTCARANAAGIATFIYGAGFSDHEFETDPVNLYINLNDTDYSFVTDSYNATAFTSQVTITHNSGGTCAVSIEMPLITNTSYTKLSYTVTNVTDGFKVTDNGYAVINFTTIDDIIVVITPCESGKTSNLPLVIGGGAAAITVIIFLVRRRR